LFADIAKIPAAQALVRRLENGGALTFSGVAASAQPFFAALLQTIFPARPVVMVASDLKTQENFQQDLETWLTFGREPKVESRGPEKAASDETIFSSRLSTFDPRPLFFPAWEIFPHEDKLPHADVISDRLQTLIALAGKSKVQSPKSTVIVTTVTALLQKTFPPGEIQKRTRELKRGEKIAPLDLIEFLEEQGYEPEAQVSQKGEIALRRGILDVFPPTSP